MTELETLQRAKMYVEKLANGIDPITDFEIHDDSVLNNVRISRCLFYVSDVLKKVIDNGGEVKKTVVRTKAFSITEEQLSAVEVSEEAVGVSIIAKRIAAVLDEGVKKVSAARIGTWLLDGGYLSENIVKDKRVKQATPKGESIGIFTVDAVSFTGVPYKKTVYNAAAQQFVINNIVQIASET